VLAAAAEVDQLVMTFKAARDCCAVLAAAAVQQQPKSSGSFGEWHCSYTFVHTGVSVDTEMLRSSSGSRTQVGCSRRAGCCCNCRVSLDTLLCLFSCLAAQARAREGAACTCFMVEGFQAACGGLSIATGSTNQGSRET
jgi:hypothetical protein